MKAKPYVQRWDFKVFCDGACWPNPGRGGWGAIVRDSQGRETEMSGCEEQSTNQRMEITAACEALETLPEECFVKLFTDSKYLIGGGSEWMDNWKRNNWMRRTPQGPEPVKNMDLWERLDLAMRGKFIQWHWVRGHNGHPENERCDVLASNARKAVGA